MSGTKHDDLHVYDGIRELENPMPSWWVATWFVTIVFSFFYVVHMDLDGTGVLDEYKVAVSEQAARDAAAALARGEVTEESLKVLGKDPATMAQAGATFVSKCALCHGERGEGGIGPNLTDSFWKNCDGDLVAIHRIIENGVSNRGMPAWGKQLDPIEIQKVAAYVGTLARTNVPGGKAPEGHEVAVCR